jgi:hypothetical protein
MEIQKIEERILERPRRRWTLVRISVRQRRTVRDNQRIIAPDIGVQKLVKIFQNKRRRELQKKSSVHTNPMHPWGPHLSMWIACICADRFCI